MSYQELEKILISKGITLGDLRKEYDIEKKYVRKEYLLKKINELEINTSSEKVMLACGMVKEAEFREHTRFKGVWVNRLEYGILNSNVSS